MRPAPPFNVGAQSALQGDDPKNARKCQEQKRNEKGLNEAACRPAGWPARIFRYRMLSEMGGCLAARVTPGQRCTLSRFQIPL